MAKKCNLHISTHIFYDHSVNYKLRANVQENH